MPNLRLIRTAPDWTPPKETIHSSSDSPVDTQPHPANNEPVTHSHAPNHSPYAGDNPPSPRNPVPNIPLGSPSPYANYSFSPTPPPIPAYAAPASPQAAIVNNVYSCCCHAHSAYPQAGPQPPQNITPYDPGHNDQIEKLTKMINQLMINQQKLQQEQNTLLRAIAAVKSGVDHNTVREMLASTNVEERSTPVREMDDLDAVTSKINAFAQRHQPAPDTTQRHVQFPTGLAQPRETHRPQPPAEQKKFVGIDELKGKHLETFRHINNWTTQGEWVTIRSSDFDALLFPIDIQDERHGLKYTVSPDDIDNLKSDPEFMFSYRNAVNLSMLAWGWDVQNNNFVQGAGQWDNNERRLQKILHSLQLFDQKDLLQSAWTFIHAVIPPERIRE